MRRIDTDDTHAGWEAQEGIRNSECGIRNERKATTNLEISNL